MVKEIYTHLKNNGLNPYFPGQHKGQCNERYCVIKENSQVPFFNNPKAGYRLIDIIAFVPISSYIQMESYINEIKACLSDFPIRYAGETSVITDDEKKAYTTSIKYQILKKL